MQGKGRVYRTPNRERSCLEFVASALMFVESTAVGLDLVHPRASEKGEGGGGFEGVLSCAAQSSCNIPDSNGHTLHWGNTWAKCDGGRHAAEPPESMCSTMGACVCITMAECRHVPRSGGWTLRTLAVSFGGGGGAFRTDRMALQPPTVNLQPPVVSLQPPPAFFFFSLQDGGGGCFRARRSTGQCGVDWPTWRPCIGLHQDMRRARGGGVHGVGGNVVRGLLRRGKFRRGKLPPPSQVPKLTLPHAHTALRTPPRFCHLP